LESQIVSEAVALAQALQNQSAALPFSDLTSKLAQASDALRTFEQRRAALRDEHADAVAAMRQREAALLLENPQADPARDAEYQRLRNAADATRQQLLSLGDAEDSLRRVVAALSAEHRARDGRLRHLVEQERIAKHKGKSADKIAAARLAVAEAILAYCAEQTTPPDGTNASYFFEGLVGSGFVNELVRKIADAERQAAREHILKRDRMLG